MNSQAPKPYGDAQSNRQPSRSVVRLHGVLRPSVFQGEMWAGLGHGWASLGYIISGIAVWGGVGWALDRLFGIAPVLMVIGVLIGNFAGVYLIYLRSFPKSEERSSAA